MRKGYIRALENEISKEFLYELYARCNEYGHYYHDLDNPIVPDEVYDECMQQIKRIEKEHPDWIRDDSPLQHVSGTASKKKLGKVVHEEQMQSLEDKFSMDEVIRWYDGLHLDESGEDNFDVEAKIDGLSVALEYRDGVLVNGSTRGDGWTGENVTENLMKVRCIPHILDQNILGKGQSTIRIRAEVVMFNEEFIKINRRREKDGEDLYANPRNAAAGILRTVNSPVVEECHLTAIAFSVMHTDVNKLQNGRQFGINQIEDLKALEHLGFMVVPYYPCKSIREIQNAIDNIHRLRENLPYWSDGAVIKVNSRREQIRIGVTTKYPKWAVAYKFKSEERTTHVIRIITQTGRTGVITPKVEFEPIELGGTVVRFATLHNQGYINALGGIANGDEIIVNKAAEIIPQVLSVNVKKRNPGTQLFRIEYCPSCGDKAVISDDEIPIAYCKNINCPAQKNRYFEFVASREILNIEGLGPSLIDRLVDRNILFRRTDIFRLGSYRAELLGMHGMGKKKTDNILRAIETSKSRPLYKVFASLGIGGCGNAVGRILENNYSDLKAISEASREELAELDGIGEVHAAAIWDFFHAPQNIGIVEELKNLGVNIISNEFQKKESKRRALNNMRFVVTGTLEGISRDEIVQLIEENGGTVSSGVSKKTDYLVRGKNAGTKLAKAEELGIKILSLDDFYKLLKSRKE